jgi:hypothetical protein
VTWGTERGTLRDIPDYIFSLAHGRFSAAHPSINVSAVFQQPCYEGEVAFTRRIVQRSCAPIICGVDIEAGVRVQQGYRFGFSAERCYALKGGHVFCHIFPFGSIPTLWEQALLLSTGSQPSQCRCRVLRDFVSEMASHVACCPIRLALGYPAAHHEDNTSDGN